jgi:uncharacterized membrane protein
MQVKWGVSAGAGLLSLMLVGTGQAWSQMVSLTVCNDSSVPATVAIVGSRAPNDSRLFIQGWYNSDTGGCGRVGDVAPGLVYLYAHSPSYGVEWAGTAQKFCVDEPGPMNRYVAGSCPLTNFKGFSGFQLGAGQYTWRLPPPTLLSP